MFRGKTLKASLGHLCLSAAAIAKAAKTTSISANEYSQLIPNRYHAPPTAINSKPMLNVLNEPRSYFVDFELLIIAKASIHTPKSTKITGTTSVQPMRPASIEHYANY